ncbi:MAG: hypothetical protein AB7F59_06555 [Bdellovibrionales bacterium]
MKRYFVLIACLVSLTLGANAFFASKFQGYQAINSTLLERLFVPGSKFTFSRFVGSADLTKLLGYHTGTGNEGGFRNGDPNPTNMVIWNLSLNSFAIWLSQACNETPVEDPIFRQLDPDVLGSLKALCAWPQASSRNEANLLKVWMLFMQYDAPEAEYLAWKDFLMSAEYARETGPLVIQEALSTLFLNPHFLLRK